MQRIFAYIINILTFMAAGLSDSTAQDTIMVPLKIKLEFELSGPVIYYFDKSTLNYEGNIVVDLNEKYSATGIIFIRAIYQKTGKGQAHTIDCDSFTLNLLFAEQLFGRIIQRI